MFAPMRALLFCLVLLPDMKNQFSLHVDSSTHIHARWRHCFYATAFVQNLRPNGANHGSVQMVKVYAVRKCRRKVMFEQTHHDYISVDIRQRMFHLKKHLLNHVGEKPFPSDHYQKLITSKQNLQNHMKKQAEVFQLHCVVCDLIRPEEGENPT